MGFMSNLDGYGRSSRSGGIG